MDKRTLLAIILSVVILISYQFIFEKLYPTPKGPVPDKAAPAETAAKVEEKVKAESPVPAPSTPKKTDPSGQEKVIIIENDLYKMTLSSLGASIRSVELKQFNDDKGAPIVLKAEESLPPLAAGTDDLFQISRLNFAVKGNSAVLGPADPKKSIVFEYIGPEVKVIRAFTFKYGDYGIELKEEVKGVTAYWITLGKEFGIHTKSDSEHTGPVVLRDADRDEFKLSNLKDPRYYKNGVKWIAQEDKYFFSALVPRTAIEEARVWDKNGTSIVGLKMREGSNEYLLYAGPKEYDNLKKYGVHLEHIVDFGWFSFLAVPLFWVLKFFYGLVHNYGVAIIIITILVRIPFIPIVNKGQASMKKLQDLQPRMAEIREKYKKDPQRMQQELMGLYKQHKVNPMGGCLPIVLQIPVFFALYQILNIAIELRGAPLALWITDLSAKDPYFILPIVMGATMVIQQKMTPSTMDPRQQKLMMFLPVIFTFLFLTFPSGLVLYWLANNVLSIIQQYYVNRKLERQSAKAS